MYCYKFYSSSLVALVILVLLFRINQVLAHPTGAPDCKNMVPRHGFNPQTSDVPYNILLSSSSYSPNDTIEVTIEGINSTLFLGFFATVRKDGSKINYGTFTPIPNTHFIKGTGCSEATLTHSKRLNVNSLKFNWTAPDKALGQLYVTVTIVQKVNTFWTNVRKPLAMVGDVTQETPISVSSTSESVTGFSSSPALSKSGSKWVCSNTFICQVTWKMTKDSTEFAFQLQLKDNNKYIAMGLSEDKKMGYDSVMECIQLSNGTVIAQFSYNGGRTEEKNIVVASKLTLLSSSVKDGIMKCVFSRKNVINNTKIFDLVGRKWHLLIAVGKIKDTGHKLHHAYTASSEKIDLSLSQSVSSGYDQKAVLVKLHALFMIFAWVFFSAVGIFFARYAKSIEKKIDGLAVWFQIHRISMIMVLLLTIIGFILIFTAVGGYSTLQTVTDRAHPVIGIIITILVFINPIMAYFRPGKDSDKRPLFNWAHRSVGVIAIIFSDVAIFIGLIMHSRSKPSFKNVYIVEMSLFIIYKVLSVIAMEAIERMSNRKSTVYEMTIPGENKIVPDDSIKTGKLKIFLMCGHAIICLSFAIALVASVYQD